MPSPHCFRRQLVSGLLTATAVISGCASVAEPIAALHDSQEAHTAPTPPAAAPELIPVMHSGRYTLAELVPTAAQRDLLLQVVDVTLPDDVRATVGDGLRHVLKRSGYQLCAASAASADLVALPLPAAHLHLGPMTLRDALLTLAGPAWTLEVDASMRQVCFVAAVPLAIGKQP
jgi:type IV pili sensor histidine kinase/response regulator